jgi:hypothetical protein
VNEELASELFDVREHIGLRLRSAVRKKTVARRTFTDTADPNLGEPTLAVAVS